MTKLENNQSMTAVATISPDSLFSLTRFIRALPLPKLPGIARKPINISNKKKMPSSDAVSSLANTTIDTKPNIDAATRTTRVFSVDF